MKKVLFLVSLTLLLTGCLGISQTFNPADQPPTVAPSPVPGTLYVDPEIDLGPINPLIYGSNHGPWVAVPVDMLETAYNSKITVVRWPGGEWGDKNDVQPYQLDFFVQSVLQPMGAEALICVRMPGGTPEQAAELVRYANLEKGYGIKYWSIGNEPTLYAGWLDETYDTVWYNQEWRKFAEAMKAVDPEIVLVGPDLHQFTPNFDANPKDPNGKDWMTEFLQANGDLVDVVSFHRYPFPKSMASPPATIPELRENLPEWDEIVIYLRGLILETTGREIPISIGEVSSHYSKAIQGEATPDSHFQAIWWADVLGRLITQDVMMVNHWMLATRSAQGGWGLVGPGEIRPSYYVYQMYAHLGNQQVYASSDDPNLRIYAALADTGDLTILLINLGDAAAEYPLQIEGKFGSQAQGWLFDADHPAESGGTVDLSSGRVELPPQSIRFLVLPAK